MPDLAGDVPAGSLATYRTASVPLPVPTTRILVRTELAPSVVTATASVITTNQYNFQLSQTPVVATLQAWDQYRIEAVRVRVTPQNNAVGLVTNSTTTLAEFYSVIDYDDSTALASLAAARGYTNCLIQQPGESCERIFRPRIAVAAYQGALTGFANLGDTWIDAAFPNVQHYGFKIVIPPVAAAQTLLQTWEVTFELFISLRNLI